MSSIGLDALLREQQQLSTFAHQASIAGWIVFALVTVVFTLRTTARIWLIDASVSPEDILISVSWLFDLLRMVFFQIALSSTRAVNLLQPGAVESKATYWIILTNTWAFLSVTLPKIGVAFLLVRIFRPQPWARNAMIGSTIGLFIIYIVAFILSFKQCNPVPAQWNPLSYPNARCSLRTTFLGYTLMASCLSALMNLAFTVDPGVVVWTVQLPTWKRLITSAMMVLGFGCFAFALATIATYSTLLSRLNQIELNSRALHIALWNSIENDLVLTVACLPGARFWFLPTIRKPNFSASTLEGLSNLKSRLRHFDSDTVEEQELDIRSQVEQAELIKLEIYVKQEFELHFEDINAYLNAQDHALRVYDWARPQLRTTKTSS